MTTIHEPARELPVYADMDVVVCGGGPGGFPAAIAAARHGAKTLLIERHGFLGGLITADHVHSIGSIHASRSTTLIVQGIIKEVVDRVHALGGCPSWESLQEPQDIDIGEDSFEEGGRWRRPSGYRGLGVDPETLKRVVEVMALEAGVELLLHTWISDAIVEDSRIKAIIVENKSGRQAVTCKMVIDATGDADVAYRAGAPTRQGREFDGAVQAMGSIFSLGGLPRLSAEELEAAKAKMRAALLEGRLHFYNPAIPTASPGKDYTWVNMTRWPGDPTKVRDLIAAELGTRRDVWDLVRFLREEVPGYENCYVRDTPPQVGPRQSRQIVGEYTLTGDDVVSGRKFDDSIARGSYFVDIHCPLGETYPVYVCVKNCPKQEECPYWVAEHDRMRMRIDCYPPEGDWYNIPYRCLVPKRIDNLLVSGRCISATHEGMASARVNGTCMAVGQAAGTAAALALQHGIAPGQLDVQELQSALVADGALI